MASEKIRVLVTGKNKMIIDDFFNHLTDIFELLTTSTRMEDMKGHIELFEPDVFVCCLNSETREELLVIKELKRFLTKKNISTIIIGSEEDCELFNKVALYMADMTLLKPITINVIRDKIMEYVHSMEKEKEEQRRLQEKLAQVQEQNERKHVLVVDDDPMQLKLIKEYLHESYDVATAISGKVARKFLENKKTNFILLDYNMPEEDGPAFLEKLRESGNYEDLPVVFLTGVTDKEKIKNALLCKPQGYLLKPIDKDKLLGTIEKFIG